MINQNNSDEINVIDVKTIVSNKLINGDIVAKNKATKNTNGINLTIAVFNSLWVCFIFFILIYLHITKLN